MDLGDRLTKLMLFVGVIAVIGFAYGCSCYFNDATGGTQCACRA